VREVQKIKSLQIITHDRDLKLREREIKMKTHAMSLLLAFAVLGAMPAFAGETMFTLGSETDVLELDHYRAYTWGIDLGFSTADTPLTEFTLTFEGIYNFDTTPNILYVRLLDEVVQPGLTVYRDRQAYGDFFEGQGALIGTWTDDREQQEKIDNPQNLVFEFSKISVGDRTLLELLNEYGTNGTVGIGFDPDCLYKTQVLGSFSTASVPPPTIVPTPAAIVLAGVGTTLVGLLRRRQQV
jgi:hypothetical protein